MEPGRGSVIKLPGMRLRACYYGLAVTVLKSVEDQGAEGSHWSFKGRGGISLSTPSVKHSLLFQIFRLCDLLQMHLMR